MTSDKGPLKPEANVRDLSGNNPAGVPPDFNVVSNNPDDDKSASIILSVIRDEILRAKVSGLIDEKPHPSRWQRFSTHSLTTIFFAFLLTGGLGTWLANNYTSKQKESEAQHTKEQRQLEQERSFNDELNKIRVQKIGEVWETIDTIEPKLDEIFENDVPPAEQQNVRKRVTNLVAEERAAIDKNRFWLGDEPYAQFEKYLDLNGSYILDKVLSRTTFDLSETLKNRAQAKQNILQIRHMLLSEQPCP